MSYKIVLCFLEAVIIIFTSCKSGYYTSTKVNNSGADTVCALSSIDKNTFSSFADKVMSPQINDACKKEIGGQSSIQQIIYILRIKQTGDYRGVLLSVNNNFAIQSMCRFSYDSRLGVKTVKGNWSESKIDLKSVFNDSTFYMSRFYMSDGTDEILTCRSNLQPVNGLIYRGCSSPTIENERNVLNKNILKLLVTLRKYAK